MRNTTKLAVLLSVFALATGFLPAAEELVLERSFPVGSGARLDFDSDRGGVSIQGEARDDILVRVLARDMDPEEARSALDLQFQETGQGIAVRARIERRGGWLSSLFGGGDGGIFFEVRVPRNTRLNVDNGSGGVSVAEIDAPVTVDNGSGGIHLDHIRGAVTVDNGSGGIKIAEIEGALSVDNGSGGVRVEAIRGDVKVDNGSGGVSVAEVVGDTTVDNGSGGVSLDGLDGALRVETSSGGIRARLVGINAGVTAETGSGGVRIEVPASWGADLDLSSREGDVIVRGWSEVRVDGQSFVGAIGGGGPRISLHSGSGDIELIAD
ncbi:MAG: DUF4097 family beta strand repeat-containing protein [Acidobacteriota bacterium]|jgi:hypothetical protein